MDNSQAVSVLVGIVLPFLISWLKQSDWDHKGKFLVAVVVSVIAGFATSWAAGNLIWAWEKALIDAAIVISVSQGFYKLILEDRDWDKRLTGSQ